MDVVARGDRQGDKREGGDDTRGLSPVPQLHALQQVPRQCATEQCQGHQRATERPQGRLLIKRVF